MEKILSLSWSNRVLLLSITSAMICLTIQAHIYQLSVPLHFLISWAIFVIAMSIWGSCVVLRMMLKINAPLTIEPFDKWLRDWVKNCLERSQITGEKSLEKFESLEKMNGVHELNTRNDNSLNNLSYDIKMDKISDQNENLHSDFVANMNLDKIINDIDSNFVKIWYNNVSNDETFPAEVNQLLRNLMKEFNYQITNINHIELSRKIGNILLLHLKEYRR